MVQNRMGLKKNNSRGFTLIASLLILVLLSGVAAGLLFLVTNESRMSGNDQENNLAYYGAESGMEYMSSSLASLYAQYMVPQTSQIQNLANFTTLPSVPNMAYVAKICFPTSAGPCAYTDTTTPPPSSWGTISAGANQGLYAETVPMTLNIVATRPLGASVNITRNVEVALIPVFQFGVFCGYDCSYFAGPNFSFGGRVHTNMNLFLASGADLVFNDKVQAYKQILTDELENGYSTASDYAGTIYIPKASGGCPLGTFPPTGSSCISLPSSSTVPGDASWSGGYPTIAGSANSSFSAISNGTFNDYLANSLTGVANLQLPFVQNGCTSNPPPCTDPIAIVRKPISGELATSTLGSERLYNKAQIRILLADNQADLHPDWSGTDANDVEFPSTTNWSTAPFVNSSGSAPTLSLTGGTTKNPNGASEAVGFATPGSFGWVHPYSDGGSATTWATWPLEEAFSVGTTTATVPANPTGSWIRVEYCATAPCNTHADFVGVTQEWLNLGIGQPFNLVPTTPGSNAINTNAILIFQELRPGVAISSANIAATNSWYPINFYDAREGEMRDSSVSNTTFTPSKTQAGYPDMYTYSSCSVSGIMNAVELDVGNLALWLKGSTGLGTGSSVLYNMENGYVLYYSDHRGMRPDPNASNGGQTPAGVYSGESGLEDVVNSGSNLTSTTQDGALETAKYYSYSPEDVDQNGKLDNWGQVDLGYGFGINTKNSATYNAYTRVGVTPTTPTAYNTVADCASYNVTPNQAQPWLTGTTDQIGMANTISGARHVLKLVDGAMSSTGVSPLPVMPAASGCTQTAANATACGGFTIASENPVYIQGNYNSSSADAFWGTSTATTPTQTAHSAASIIADSVTLLSNQWTDAYSLLDPTLPTLTVPLPASTTTFAIRQTTADSYYRVAISGGKNVPFPQPNWTGVSKDFGTDGGMHNFLRYLESWGNTLHYNGSLVSMYYSEYDTGTFKCCTTVYSPPTRDYYFDTLFLNPSNLPPATPEFQDIVNMSYYQSFSPQNVAP